jgi:hypothetical protein
VRYQLSCPSTEVLPLVACDVTDCAATPFALAIVAITNTTPSSVTFHMVVF